jgi:hypothetical protein
MPNASRTPLAFLILLRKSLKATLELMHPAVLVFLWCKARLDAVGSQLVSLLGIQITSFFYTVYNSLDSKCMAIQR